MVNRYIIGVIVFLSYSACVAFLAFNSGINSIKADLLDAQNKLIKRQNEEHQQWLADRSRLLVEISELHNRPPEVVTNEIIKAVESSDCKRISADIIRLLNEPADTKARTDTKRVAD